MPYDDIPILPLLDSENGSQDDFILLDDILTPDDFEEFEEPYSVLDALLEELEPYSVDTPVTGNMASNTLTYFDRVVDGLPDYYKYVAFADNASDSYSGILVYGSDYKISGNTITFNNADVVSVYRVRQGTTSTYYTYYSHSTISNKSFSLPATSTVLYYTNAVDGFPVLGYGLNTPQNSISTYLSVAVFLAVLFVLLNKLFFRYK